MEIFRGYRGKMVTNTKLNFHYNIWKQFNIKTFQSTIGIEDMKGRKFHLERYFALIQQGETKQVFEAKYDNAVYKFEKNGELYLLDERDIVKLPGMAKDTQEMFLKPSDKTIHKLIKGFKSTALGAKKTIEIRDFITYWNYVEHTDEKSRLFMNMVSLASQWKSIKLWICGDPGSGKTSNFNIDKYIFNNVAKHAALTKAKLETSLFYNKVLLIDELTSAKKSDMEPIEPIFLMIADESQELEKSSMAKMKAMGKMDLSDTSIVFAYNRPKDVEGSTFFEQKWSNIGALRRRYPVIYVEGKVTSVLKKTNSKQAESLMLENEEALRIWAKNKVYFAKYLDRYIHNYNQTVPLVYTGQALTNFEGALDVIDAYCNSQEEFDEWCRWINNQNQKYLTMIGHNDFSSGKLFN